MTKTPAYAAPAAGKPLAPFTIDRREPGPLDVDIDVLFCGVCHSDIHQARDEWTGATFPMVPGHEIVGRVRRVGAAVKRFRAGDMVGVGCMVDSCRDCDPCRHDTEQFCDATAAWTYNGTEMDRKTPTYGGYSKRVVVAERFVLKIPAGLDPAAAAPLLCAGITTYSPLRQWNCKKGDRVGVVGLGGLGHMAVKLAAAMGAEVTVLSTSKTKEADARRLGAHAFASTADATVFTTLAKRFDLLIDTVSAPHDYNLHLGPPAPPRRDGRRRRAAGAGAGVGLLADRRQPTPRRVADRRHPARRRRCSTSAAPTGSSPTSRSSRSRRSTRPTSACSAPTCATAS